MNDLFREIGWAELSVVELRVLDNALILHPPGARPEPAAILEATSALGHLPETELAGSRAYDKALHALAELGTAGPSAVAQKAGLGRVYAYACLAQAVADSRAEKVGRGRYRVRAE